MSTEEKEHEEGYDIFITEWISAAWDWLIGPAQKLRKEDPKECGPIPIIHRGTMPPSICILNRDPNGTGLPFKYKSVWAYAQSMRGDDPEYPMTGNVYHLFTSTVFIHCKEFEEDINQHCDKVEIYAHPWAVAKVLYYMFECIISYLLDVDLYARYRTYRGKHGDEDAMEWMKIHANKVRDARSQIVAEVVCVAVDVYMDYLISTYWPESETEQESRTSLGDLIKSLHIINCDSILTNKLLGEEELAECEIRRNEWFKELEKELKDYPEVWYNITE